MMNTNKSRYTSLLAIVISFLWGFSTPYVQAALPSSIPAGLKLYDIYAADGCSMVLQQSSKIITIAALGNDTSQMNMAVVRFNSNGQLDPTFGVNGRIRIGSAAVGADIDVTGFDGSLCSGAIQLNGKIILAGFLPSSKRIIVLRLEENGSLDVSFGINGFYAFPLEEFGFKWSWGVNKVAVDSAQRILVAGGVDIPRTNSQQQGFLIRINATGQLDTTFNDNTGYFVWNTGYSYFSEVVQDNNGNILLGGCSGGCGDYTAEAVVIRLTSNGKLDTGFADNGIRYLPLFSDSNPSQSMPGNRSIKLISIDSLGRIVATGTNYYAGGIGITYRLDTNGNLDPTYINDYFVPHNVPVSQRVDSTGILFVGSTLRSYYDDYVGLLKLDSNGVVQPFPTFPPPTILENSNGETLWRMIFDGYLCSESPGGAIFQPDGKIVVAGNFGCGDQRVYQGIYLARFNPDSSIDETFGSSTPPPSEEKVAVVLVHGIAGSASSFGDDGKFYFYDSDCVGPTLDSTCQPKFGNELRKEGFLVGQPFDFSSKSPLLKIHWRTYSIEQLAGELSKHLQCVENERSCAPVEKCESVICVKPIVPVDVKKVDILAHSMGGLIARAYIAGLAVDKDNNNASMPYRGDIRKLIMAGTPNYGSSLAGELGGLFGKKQAKDMNFGSKFIWDLDQKWKEVDFPVENLLAIGSNLITEEINNSLDPRENYTESSDCGVVTVASAALPEKQDGLPKFMYVPYKHANINSILLPCEALSIVGINDTNHETYRLARDFLKGKPLIGIEPTDTPHEAGLLLVRVADSSTKKPISVDKWFYLLLIDGLEPADEDKRSGLDKNLTIRLVPKLDPYHITLKTSGKGKYKSVSTESVTIKPGRPQSSIIWVTK